MFPYMVFFCFFFQNYLLFFSYWAGWEFSFIVFFFKTPWIATVFSHMIFLLWFFSKLSLSILLFLILNWLRITIRDFLIKHYRLLQCFPAWFFFLLFFLWFFSKLSLSILFFLILSSLRIYLCRFLLENITNCNSFSSYDFFSTNPL